MTTTRTDRQFLSARQRVVILTFATIEDAEEWDWQGQPVEVGGWVQAEVVELADTPGGDSDHETTRHERDTETEQTR
jgi:hypothetical protein